MSELRYTTGRRHSYRFEPKSLTAEHIEELRDNLADLTGKRVAQIEEPSQSEQLRITERSHWRMEFAALLDDLMEGVGVSEAKNITANLPFRKQRPLFALGIGQEELVTKISPTISSGAYANIIRFFGAEREHFDQPTREMIVDLLREPLVFHMQIMKPARGAKELGGQLQKCMQLLDELKGTGPEIIEEKRPEALETFTRLDMALRDVDEYSGLRLYFGETLEAEDPKMMKTVVQALLAAPDATQSGLRMILSELMIPRIRTEESPRGKLVEAKDIERAPDEPEMLLRKRRIAHVQEKVQPVVDAVEACAKALDAEVGTHSEEALSKLIANARGAGRRV